MSENPDEIQLQKNAAQRRRRRLIAYGRWEAPLVDPTRAREHVAYLRQWGLSYDAVSHLAGLSEGMVEQICLPGHNAYRHTIRRETEQAILSAAFDLDDLLDHFQVDICGTQRRIRALRRIGWPQEYIASRLGISSSVVGQLLGPQYRYVGVGRARAIRDLYAELHMKLGPSQFSVTWAANRGWPPPWAWDDETIDHPDTEPDLDCLHRPAKRSSEDTFEDVLWIMQHEPMITRDKLAERLGTTADSISNVLARVADYRVQAAYPKGWHGPLTEEAQAALSASLAEVNKVRAQLWTNVEEATGRPVTFKPAKRFAS
jgi:hypothetical protein